MGEKVERVLGWVAALAVLLAAAALAITFVPGVRPYYDKLLAALPRATPKLTIDDAQDALDGGNAAEAKRIAQAVVAVSGADANIDNRAGNIAQRSGDEATAEQDYQLGEAADPKNPWNYVALGELYARQGKYSLADAQLRAALALAPDAQFLHYDLGVAELREHLATAALADFNAELKRSPNYAPALEGKAEALAMLGRPVDVHTAQLLAMARRNGNASPAAGASVASPGASPSAKPAASPSASPRATNLPKPAPSPSPTLTIAKIVLPSPSPSAVASTSPLPTPSPRKSPAKRIGVARPLATPILPPTPLASPSRPPLPRSIADLASDAKGYLFDVASDPGFTQALPFADPRQSVASMQAAISKGSVNDALSAGTAAMLTHHFSIAQSAFASASERAPGDWRGPYLAGLNAQQRGDQATARTYFTQAAGRGGAAAVYVSLAIANVAEGADSDAYDSAQHALALQPGFGPALFTAGMVDILVADAPAAERDLAAASASGGAPERTTYFLTSVRDRRGSSP